MSSGLLAVKRVCKSFACMRGWIGGDCFDGEWGSPWVLEEGRFLSDGVPFRSVEDTKPVRRRTCC